MFIFGGGNKHPILWLLYLIVGSYLMIRYGLWIILKILTA